MSPQVKESLKRAIISGVVSLVVGVATALASDPTYGAYAAAALMVVGRISEGRYDQHRNEQHDVHPSDVGSIPIVTNAWR